MLLSPRLERGDAEKANGEHEIYAPRNLPSSETVRRPNSGHNPSAGCKGCPMMERAADENPNQSGCGFTLSHSPIVRLSRHVRQSKEIASEEADGTGLQLRESHRQSHSLFVAPAFALRRW